MSEKRIFVAEIGFRNCPLMTFDNICVVDKNCEDGPCKAGITRAEAVDRINHALCVKIYGPCNQCVQVHCHCDDYKSYAEVALDALLEVKE